MAVANCWVSGTVIIDGASEVFETLDKVERWAIHRGSDAGGCGEGRNGGNEEFDGGVHFVDLIEFN